MRRSILALPLALALVVGAPGPVWAGHKYRIPTSTKTIGSTEYKTYTMEGALPLKHGGAEVDAAIAAKCKPTRGISVVYVRKTTSRTYAYESRVGTVQSNRSFKVAVNLPRAISGTYQIRIRCAQGLTRPSKPTSTTSLVSVSGRSDPYTMFTDTFPVPPSLQLPYTGSSSALLLVAGVALLLLGGLLLGYDRRLGRPGQRVAWYSFLGNFRLSRPGVIWRDRATRLAVRAVGRGDRAPLVPHGHRVPGGAVRRP